MVFWPDASHPAGASPFMPLSTILTPATKMSGSLFFCFLLSGDN